MRNLLILGMLACGAFFAGWFTIERDGDRTRIEINKAEIKGDIGSLKERGREYLDRQDERRGDAYVDDQRSQDQRSQYDDRYDPNPRTDYRSYEDRNATYQDRSFNQAERFPENRDYRSVQERRPY